MLLFFVGFFVVVVPCVICAYTYSYVSPLQGSGDILFFPSRPSVGLSVCVSVCLSVIKSCPLYNLKTVTDISTKLHTFVKQIETTCHA